MQIDSIQLVRVPLEPEEPADAAGALESVFVGLSSGEHTGWSEVSLPRTPLECEEWPAGIFSCLREFLAPRLVGREIDSGRALQTACGHIEGNQRAKAALDIAWWNLTACVRQRPLSHVLGGRPQPTPLGCTLGVMNSQEELFAALHAAFAQGHALVTLKFRPGWGLEMLRAVRQAFPAESLAIDCDGLCSLADQEMFYRLEDFQLAFIEQPMAADDLVAHAMLQENIRTPIVLDQSVTSLARAEQAIDLGSCREMRIHPARVGGLTPALDIRAACEAVRMGCSLGGSPQGAWADCAAAALTGLGNFSQPAEIFARAFAEPWCAGERAGWFVSLPSGARGIAALDFPGALTLDVEALRAAARDHVTIG